ncbi:polyphosphate polymerase domain-containing protein [Solibacillus sp. FSL R7-0668]|uniref:polyphosphate polymerase domain-containing protein n=1 Tax=Solibacillus sp. FSL R7-0668 TaxID=2921688 RepID=UPI002F79EE90
MAFENKHFRHELKYYITYFEMIALRKKIASFLSLDKHATSPDGYNIRSLYFDGMHEHSLHDKNDGIFGREKYRIRIYNENDAIIKLERKSKYGDYINKEGAPLTREDYDAILRGEYHSLKERPEVLTHDFYRALEFRRFQPRVIVDYTREAYIYELGNVRITFDKELRAGINGIDLFHKNNVFQEILYPEQVILEVKYDDFLPDVIRQLLQPERLTRSAISKYVLCRERTIQYFKV